MSDLKVLVEACLRYIKFLLDGGKGFKRAVSIEVVKVFYATFVPCCK